MIFHDVSHTSHCHSNSGVQRVVRELNKHLSAQSSVTPITFDSYANHWRTLDSDEECLLCNYESITFGQQRKGVWSLKQKLRGWSQRLTPSAQPDFKEADAFIASEIFKPREFKAYSKLFPLIREPRIAVFYDAIALKLPELTPEKTCKRMPDYMRELLKFDGVAAISEDSRASLEAFWDKEHVPKSERPVLRAIPLATHLSQQKVPRNETCTPPEVLFVSTLEGRKNHKALLEAAQMLWDADWQFTLRLIGALNPETGGSIAQKIYALQSNGYTITWDGSVSEDALKEAYARCEFTVYPSLYEGFGIPVLESLSYQKPCVCTPYGALEEVAREGGCLMLKDGSPTSIAKGMERMLSDAELRKRLTDEASTRTFKNWDTYAEEFLCFLEEVRVMTLESRK